MDQHPHRSRGHLFELSRYQESYLLSFGCMIYLAGRVEIVCRDRHAIDAVRSQTNTSSIIAAGSASSSLEPTYQSGISSI